MKNMTAQVGNRFDSFGALFVNVVTIVEGLPKGFDTAFVYWDPRDNQYLVGLTNANRKKAPDFKEADLYCTCVMPYDMVFAETAKHISHEIYEAACKVLGKPDFLMHAQYS